MKKRFSALFACVVFFTACQTNGDKPADGASTDPMGRATAVALCGYSPTDSVTAMAQLQGKWSLHGIQTNYMGAKDDEFLTGEQMGEPKTLTFYPGGEYEEHVNGRLQGERKAFKQVGQSLPPVGYQFWFCGDSVLVVSNIISDGVTEVYSRQ